LPAGYDGVPLSLDDGRTGTVLELAAGSAFALLRRDKSAFALLRRDKTAALHSPRRHNGWERGPNAPNRLFFAMRKIFLGAIWCDLVRFGANSAVFCGWGCDGDRRLAVSMQKRTADER
jgi:hypothetical protein